MNLLAASVIGGAVLVSGVLWRFRDSMWGGRSGNKGEPVIKQLVPTHGLVPEGGPSGLSRVAPSDWAVTEGAAVSSLPQNAHPLPQLKPLNLEGNPTEQASLAAFNAASETSDNPPRDIVDSTHSEEEIAHERGAIDYIYEAEEDPPIGVSDQSSYPRTEGVTYIAPRPLPLWQRILTWGQGFVKWSMRLLRSS